MRKFFGMILSRQVDWLTELPDAAKHLLQRQLKLLAEVSNGAGAQAALAYRLAAPHRPELRLYYLAEMLLAKFKRCL